MTGVTIELSPRCLPSGRSEAPRVQVIMGAGSLETQVMLMPRVLRSNYGNDATRRLQRSVVSPGATLAKVAEEGG